MHRIFFLILKKKKYWVEPNININDSKLPVIPRHKNPSARATKLCQPLPQEQQNCAKKALSVPVTLIVFKCFLVPAMLMLPNRREGQKNAAYWLSGCPCVIQTSTESRQWEPCLNNIAKQTRRAGNETHVWINIAQQTSKEEDFIWVTNICSDMPCWPGEKIIIACRLQFSYYLHAFSSVIIYMPLVHLLFTCLYIIVQLLFTCLWFSYYLQVFSSVIIYMPVVQLLFTSL